MHNGKDFSDFNTWASRQLMVAEQYNCGKIRTFQLYKIDALSISFAQSGWEVIGSYTSWKSVTTPFRNLPQEGKEGSKILVSLGEEFLV